ncbi:kinesin-like protein KIF18B [Eleutherodactylus coqui]|uniref:kinesin-like protein KIF18B n=1 Tax=Eleutherodactylus coqui TaxID=57060 RepID=UPI0034638258
MAAPVAAEEGNVSVVVRVRPTNSREQEGNQYSVVQVVDQNILVFDPDEPETSGIFSNFKGHDGTKRKGKDLKFIFDRVFGEPSSQQDVFEHTTKPILDGVLNGYNCSVFAYGATGAGKTHTMLGSEADPGVMFLTMVELYQRIEAIKEEKSCEVLISYLEVYNEQIQDLLEPKGFLAIREDPVKGVVVQGLSFHQPNSAKQLLQMLANGNLNRTQHPTDANATSSRSHAVFQIYVKQQDRMASIIQDIRMAKMSLIDLAGSERASSTNAKGERLREGANINRSLLALINVINALADAKNKKTHIPYRDSKLTRLLKDSIGGNCRTVMIAAVSPSCLTYDDTYNTLKYANRAKDIKLALKSNVINLDCHISKYAAVCEELKAEVAELKAKLHYYEVKGSNQDTTETSSLCHSPVLRKSPSLHTSSSEQGLKKPLQSSSELSLQRLHYKRHSKKKDYQDSGFDSFESGRGETNRSILLSPHNRGTGKFVAALLNVVHKQYAMLKQANLQTPEMDAELQALKVLTHGDPEVAGTLQTDEEQKVNLDEESSKGLREDDCQLPTVKDEPLVQASPPKKRQPVKRNRWVLLPDTSPSLHSPMVPLKRRRLADTPSKSSQLADTPSKSSQVLPSTPEVQVKRPRKSSIPSRPNLRSSANRFPQKATDLPGASQPKQSLSIPKHITQTMPSILSQTVTKARVPLRTSALQNSASARSLNVRDMNTTFDISEEGWIMSEVDKTVVFGPSDFLGFENVGVPVIDCNFVKSSDIPVFTTNGLSVKGPKSTSCASSKKRRRRSMSTSSSRVGSGTVSQSRIGRLQFSTRRPVQQPPTIAERRSVSPRGQNPKKTGKGTVAFGRSLGGMPTTRLMQLSATRT